MKKLGLAAVAACGICAASALIFSTSEPANAAGEWTKCVAWYGGETWNIVNGGTARKSASARRGSARATPT